MDNRNLAALLVFAGLMSLLGAITKIILSAMQRRKGLPSAADSAALADIASRLARLEQVAESTAIEVERIGEGQRFTTKVLTERSERR